MCNAFIFQSHLCDHQPEDILTVSVEDYANSESNFFRLPSSIMNSEAASFCSGYMKALPSLNSFETSSYCGLPALLRIMRN